MRVLESIAIQSTIVISLAVAPPVSAQPAAGALPPATPSDSPVAGAPPASPAPAAPEAESVPAPASPAEAAPAPSPASVAPPPGPASTPPPAAPPPGPASTPPATQTASEKPPDKRRSLGLGYKIGNGIGFLGGDIIIAPIDHVALDLQTSYASWGDATGYGLAPALQLQLNPGPESTPYLGVGLQYVHMTLDNVTGSGTGVFANLGYEWRWSSGLGVLLGGGVQYLQEVSATDGTTTVTTGGKAQVNLEVGIRYMFI